MKAKPLSALPLILVMVNFGFGGVQSAESNEKDTRMNLSIEMVYAIDTALRKIREESNTETSEFRTFASKEFSKIKVFEQPMKYIVIFFPRNIYMHDGGLQMEITKDKYEMTYFGIPRRWRRKVMAGEVSDL